MVKRWTLGAPVFLGLALVPAGADAQDAEPSRTWQERLALEPIQWQFDNSELRIGATAAGALYTASQEGGPAFPDGYENSGASALASANVRIQRTFDNGLVLGAENREKCDELPLDDDLPELFQAFPADSGLVYWHDTGHAHLKEKLGLIDHEELLRANAGRLAGFHVHDVRGFADHAPPGTGEVDFAMVARYVRPEHYLTLELNPRLNPTEIVEAKKFAIERFGGEV